MCSQDVTASICGRAGTELPGELTGREPVLVAGGSGVVEVVQQGGETVRVRRAQRDRDGEPAARGERAEPGGARGHVGRERGQPDLRRRSAQRGARAARECGYRSDQHAEGGHGYDRVRASHSLPHDRCPEAAHAAGIKPFHTAEVHAATNPGPSDRFLTRGARRRRCGRADRSGADLRVHESGCRDLNPGPQRPERCALTKLRHTPWADGV